MKVCITGRIVPYFFERDWKSRIVRLTFIRKKSIIKITWILAGFFKLSVFDKEMKKWSIDRYEV